MVLFASYLKIENEMENVEIMLPACKNYYTFDMYSEESIKDYQYFVFIFWCWMFDA